MCNITREMLLKHISRQYKFLNFVQFTLFIITNYGMVKFLVLNKKLYQTVK